MSHHTPTHQVFYFGFQEGLKFLTGSDQFKYIYNLIYVKMKPFNQKLVVVIT